MPETRVVETVYGIGGYDPSKPNNNIVEQKLAVISDEQFYQEQLAEEMNAVHEQAIAAYKNWGSLTLAQKDAILKNLVRWALWKDGWLKLGVL